MKMVPPRQKKPGPRPCLWDPAEGMEVLELGRLQQLLCQKADFFFKSKIRCEILNPEEQQASQPASLSSGPPAPHGVLTADVPSASPHAAGAGGACPAAGSSPQERSATCFGRRRKRGERRPPGEAPCEKGQEANEGERHPGPHQKAPLL